MLPAVVIAVALAPWIVGAGTQAPVTDPLFGPFEVEVELSAGTGDAGCDLAERSGALSISFYPSAASNAYEVVLVDSDSGRVASGATLVGEGLIIEAEGGNTDYTETYEINGTTGTYTFNPGDLRCRFAVEVTSGIGPVAAALGVDVSGRFDRLLGMAGIILVVGGLTLVRIGRAPSRAEG